jgi:hypothetical protein
MMKEGTVPVPPAALLSRAMMVYYLILELLYFRGSIKTTGMKPLLSVEVL